MKKTNLISEKEEKILKVNPKIDKPGTISYYKH